MLIQYVKAVQSPRALVGEMHEIRDLEPVHAQILIEGGNAISVEKKPVPVVTPKVEPKPEPVAPVVKTKSKKRSKKFKTSDRS